MQKVLLFITLLFLANSILCQTTTGTLKGKITTEQNEPVEFATVIVIKTSTGSKFGIETDKNGMYAFQQLSPGNDYKIIVRSINFEEKVLFPIQIKLGESTKLNIKLEHQATELDEVEIIARRDDPFDNPKSGNEVVLSEEIINDLPTLNRSIQDLTKTLPEGNLNSFGGANYRFNNLSIDGSSTNDVLGFQEPASGAAGSAASGTPGGLAGTQPIGFGALGAIAIKTAPFDVIYGNFTGASINAVTKSGTNKFSGEVYSFARNNWFIGNYAGGVRQPNTQFYDIQAGASIGGAIKKDKLFYFVNIEFADRKEPVLNAPGSENSEIPLSVVQNISDTLKERYGYDPGTYQSSDIQQQSLKAFLRFDYNISTKHKLTLRNNFVQGYKDYLDWAPNFFSFGNQGYRHSTINNSTVLELRSVLNNNFSNKLTVSHSIVEDDRTYGGEVFPHLEITYNTANTIFAGSYREASIYGATLNTSQITDNLTYSKGKHTVIFGGTLERNDIAYRFLTAWNGRWKYNSIDDFYDDQPSRVRGVYNTDNNSFDYNKNNPSADFVVLLGGIYLQDEVDFSEQFTLRYGVRMDMQHHVGEFPLSEEIRTTDEFANYENDINGKPQINPRFSFNYTNKKNNIMFRGGSGLFTGRMPFAWYAYAHYISGTNYLNIDYRPSDELPITRDLSELSSLQPGLAEVNLVDNDFNLPRDWKSNIAVDIKLPKEILFTLEGTFTKVLNGLYFKSINRKDSLGTFSGADNRPYYLAQGEDIKINKNLTNVFLISNTNQGYRYNLTASLKKTAKHYTGYFGYTFGESRDLNSTVRNSHAANFEWNQAVNSANPDLAYSNFDIRHKFVSYHFYEFNVQKSKFKIGVLARSQSGSPYSFVYEGDVNRDGSSKNDLIYIPATSSEINFAPIEDGSGNIVVTPQEQWNSLDSYIENNDYLSANRGQYAERNGPRTPWNHQIDLRFSYTKELKNNKSIEILFDIFNFANLINPNWGKQHFVPNVQNSGYSLIKFVEIENEQPVYQFNDPSGNPWLIDPLNSRWEAHVGVNFSF
ncbi:MAG: hypothetical protein COA32_08465 [Fluviicola sp.]|nr:MAG: hypothetical protein COA32_08465 [Fluviicola sp.]